MAQQIASAYCALCGLPLGGERTGDAGDIDRPFDRIAAGASAGVDLMVGSNVDEWNFFMVPGGMIDRITPELAAGVVTAYGLPR